MGRWVVCSFRRLNLEIQVCTMTYAPSPSMLLLHYSLWHENWPSSHISPSLKTVLGLRVRLLVSNATWVVGVRPRVQYEQTYKGIDGTTFEITRSSFAIFDCSSCALSSPMMRSHGQPWLETSGIGHLYWVSSKESMRSLNFSAASSLTIFRSSPSWLYDFAPVLSTCVSWWKAHAAALLSPFGL